MTLDKKSQQQLLIVAGLAGALVLVSLKAVADVKKIKQKRKAAPPAAAAVPVTPAASAAAARPTIAPEELYDKLEKETNSMELERDPFFVFTQAKPQGLDLHGIFWDAQEPRVIIDGQLLKKGEKVGKYTVIEIRKDRVILGDGQVEKELRIEF